MGGKTAVLWGLVFGFRKGLFFCGLQIYFFGDPDDAAGGGLYNGCWLFCVKDVLWYKYLMFCT